MGFEILKRDTNGIKGLLNKAEFGYDDYPAGGDEGRVYIGTGTENIPLATKGEVDTNKDLLEVLQIQLDTLLQGGRTSGGGSPGNTIPNAIRGVFAGGISALNENRMEYITIATLGNASIFGYLGARRAYLAGVNSATRGVYGGGSRSSNLSLMEYITIATLGNAINFGDLITRNALAGVSSPTRGVFGGNSILMDYITIHLLGNSTNFGDLTQGRAHLAGVSSGTRGVFAGGRITPNIYSHRMDYITIATIGNATTFGDLTPARGRWDHGRGYLGGGYLTGISSDTRGVFGGGGGSSISWHRRRRRYSPNYTNILDYITIATIGNATDFGDLTVARRHLAGVSSNTRGVFGGGHTGSSINTLDHISISTTGNAVDFGDLLIPRHGLAGVQGS